MIIRCIYKCCNPHCTKKSILTLIFLIVNTYKSVEGIYTRRWWVQIQIWRWTYMYRLCKILQLKKIDYFPWQVFLTQYMLLAWPSCGGCFSLTCLRPSVRPCVLSFLLNDPVLSLLDVLLETYLYFRVSLCSLAFILVPASEAGQ